MHAHSLHPEIELRVLHDSGFYQLAVSDDRQTTLLRRSARPFPDTIALLAENDQLVALFKSCPAGGMVVDMRAAPPNNELAFERAMASLRTAVGKAFQRVIVLVESASGAMQVTRLQRADGTAYHVTRDPRRAWRLATKDEV